MIPAAESLPDFLSEDEILGNLSSLQLVMYFWLCRTGCNLSLDKILPQLLHTTPGWRTRQQN